METIISYIDNLFRNYPDTPQVRRAREELLGIMEDKYHELKDEGKSENEAIGIVISEFGSMDEIAAALCADQQIPPKADPGQEPENEIRLTLEQAVNYLNAQETFGTKIGFGVMLCILSPVASCLVSALQEAGIFTSNLADSLGAIILFGMVAIAVGIFIISGNAVSKYEAYKKSKIILDYSAKKEINGQYEAFHQASGAKIAVGVILCILSVIPAILASAIFEGTSLYWISDLSGSGLFLFVAAGVFLFITVGTKQSAFERLLDIGNQSAKKAKQEKNDKRIQLVASIYWPVVTAAYLIWSFATWDWGFSWIIWPVAGIIFGSISAVISQL
ncbi:MAG: hypothetical protein HFJ04_08405 [Lachnospiraceae bacterium]|nr:hypothetical protein [Lachnospiraceae bacterium]